jgi:hypothetical protein
MVVHPRLVPYIAFALYLILASVLLSFGMFLWWRFLDPVAPNIHVISSEAIDHGQGIFEVKRLVESDQELWATVHAEFWRVSPATPLRLPDGREVIPDPARFEVAPVQALVQRGLHLRDRIWQMPARLPAGEYVYRSRFEFCNAFQLKCVNVELPPGPVPAPAPAPDKG